MGWFIVLDGPRGPLKGVCFPLAWAGRATTSAAQPGLDANPHGPGFAGSARCTALESRNRRVCHAPGNDVMGGSGDDDELLGNSGNDDVSGGSGDDQLWGGEGHDVLAGDNDDDALIGGPGIDDIDAGAGNDDIVILDWGQSECL